VPVVNAPMLAMAMFDAPPAVTRMVCAVPPAVAMALLLRMSSSEYVDARGSGCHRTQRISIVDEDRASPGSSRENRVRRAGTASSDRSIACGQPDIPAALRRGIEANRIRAIRQNRTTDGID
jgi:hypothetical protein